MTMKQLGAPLRNIYDCNPDYNKGTGVCGGASLTWLAQAIKGNHSYNPHTSSALDETKRVMREICHGSRGDGSGSTEERVLWGGKCAKLSLGRVLARASAIRVEKACEVLKTLNGNYAILWGSHIMAVSVRPNKVLLLDNEHGLYKGNNVSDLVDTLKELRGKEMGYLRKKPGPKWIWTSYLTVTIIQFR